MHNSQRYRSNAEVCLKAAHACGSHYQSLNLLMAQTWLKLARHDQAIDHLLTDWGIEEPEQWQSVVPSR